MSGDRPGPRFVAVSTNPAIDRIASTEGAASGVVHASELLETPGGKAIHAACVAAELGAEAAVITTAGGAGGERLLALLEPAPVAVHPVAVTGSTRGTYTVAGPGGDLVEVHEPAEALSSAECDRLVSAVERLACDAKVIAVCGSLPPGSPTDLHARLIAAARRLGACAILDCSTPEALTVALAEGPDLVAPNLGEARRLLAAEPGDGGDAELSALAEAIRERGAGAVWLSAGAGGSLLVTADARLRISAPAPERIVNAVGCGDALVGGLAAGLVAGRALSSAAVLGAAAAAEKLSHLDPGRVVRDRVEALVGVIDVRPLRAEVGVG